MFKQKPHPAEWNSVRITFDNNALVNLENGTGQIDALRELRTLHKARKIRICIPAMAASEHQKGNVTFSNYGQFIEFLKKIELDDMEELQPVGFYGVSFYGHCVFAGDMWLDHAIHDILFPGVQYDHENSDETAMSKDGLSKTWRNLKCDVQALWCHIHYGADIFVTEDKNFHKATKKPELLKLGAKRIDRPAEALTFLNEQGIAE